MNKKEEAFKFIKRRIFSRGRVLIALVFLLSRGMVFGADTLEYDFKNQSIRDILDVLSRSSGINILPDGTVKGVTSYHFIAEDFDKAFLTFLKCNDLHWEKSGGTYFVSAVGIIDSGNETYSISAESVTPSVLLTKLSRVFSQSVLWNSLPSESLSFHCVDLPPDRILSMLTALWEDYVLESGDGYFHIRHYPGGTGGMYQENISCNSGGFSFHITMGMLGQILPEFFSLAEREAVFLDLPNIKVEDLHLSNLTFDEGCRMLCLLGGLGCRELDDTFYLYHLQSTPREPFISTMRIPLIYISARHLVDIIPPAVDTRGIITLDEPDNAVILSGYPEQVAPVKEFIDSVDQPGQLTHFTPFTTRYVSAADITERIPGSFPVTSTVLTGTYSFLVGADPSIIPEIQAFVAMYDFPGEVWDVPLRYLSPEEYLQGLSPELNPGDFSPSPRDDLLYYSGTREQYQRILADLETVDHPPSVIRYELLIIEYHRNRNFSYDFDFSFSDSATGASTGLLGGIGELLTLNFDVVSIFGSLFSIDLSNNLQEATARVLADTTLKSVSGKPVTFRNTSTYRYQEPVSDTSGDQTPGTSREIVSGLMIDIEGKQRGEEEMDIEIAATISRRGSENGSGVLPSTQEKVIETTIHAVNGEPVIISGLVHQEAAMGENKIPGIGDIPVLEYLFKSEDRSRENTEMVIYLIPYIEREEKQNHAPYSREEYYYNTFVRDSGVSGEVNENTE